MGLPFLAHGAKFHLKNFSHTIKRALSQIGPTDKAFKCHLIWGKSFHLLVPYESGQVDQSRYKSSTFHSSNDECVQVRLEIPQVFRPGRSWYMIPLLGNSPYKYFQRFGGCISPKVGNSFRRPLYDFSIRHYNYSEPHYEGRTKKIGSTE